MYVLNTSSEKPRSGPHRSLVTAAAFALLFLVAALLSLPVMS